MSHISKLYNTYQNCGLSWLWVSFMVLLLDQTSKHMAHAYLTYGHAFNIFSGLNFTLLHNAGGAFSFLAEAGGWQQLLFLAVGIVISVGLLMLLKKMSTFQVKINLGAALVLGGALGNLYDRAIFHYVVDFIDVYVGAWHWPAFNVADAAVCIGVLLLLLSNKDLEEAWKHNTS